MQKRKGSSHERICHAFGNGALCLLLQNLVFTGGFGASEAVRISSKPRYVLSFALFITVFSAATSIICRALELLHR